MQLCEVAAEPGGCGLFLKAFCCPCLVTGAINEKLEMMPGGCFGGGLAGYCCGPCFMAVAAPKANNTETPLKAFFSSCFACTGQCYLSMVRVKAKVGMRTVVGSL